jgi:phage-related protein
MMPFFERIIKALEPIFDVFAKIIGKLMDVVTRIIDKLIPPLEKVFDIVAFVFEALEPILVALVDALVPAIDALMPVLDMVIDVVDLLLVYFGPMLKLALNIIIIIVRLLSKYVEFFMGIMQKVFTAIQTAVAWLIDQIEKVFGWMWKWTEKFRSKEEKASDAAGEIAKTPFQKFLQDVFGGLDWDLSFQQMEEATKSAEKLGEKPGAGGPMEMRVPVGRLASEVEKQTMSTEDAKQIQQETAEQMVSKMEQNAKLTEESTRAMQAVGAGIEEIKLNTQRMVNLMSQVLPQVARKA